MTQTPLAFEKPKRLTQKIRVIRVLSDGLWHPTWDFCEPETGTSGLQRLTELRREGHAIEKRQIKGSSAYEYRLPWSAKP